MLTTFLIENLLQLFQRIRNQYQSMCFFTPMSKLFEKTNFIFVIFAKFEAKRTQNTF
jgi:hypothetical protein